MRLKETIAIAIALAPAFGWAQMAQRLQPAAVQTSDPAAEMLEADAADVEVVLPVPPADITAGGGMATISPARAELIDCTFSENEARSGGAIWNHKSGLGDLNVSLRRCVFRQNWQWGGRWSNLD